MSAVEKPTSGRIVRYVLSAEDHPHPGLIGQNRPAIIVEARPAAFDIVVFTRGQQDFAVGRPGCEGTLLVSGVPIADPKKDPKPGEIFWPPRTP